MRKAKTDLAPTTPIEQIVRNTLEASGESNDVVETQVQIQDEDPGVLEVQLTSSNDTATDTESILILLNLAEVEHGVDQEAPDFHSGSPKKVTEKEGKGRCVTILVITLVTVFLLALPFLIGAAIHYFGPK